MTYDITKFERGQVWMVRFKQQEAIGHEQKKDRPWLVLSVGKFNKSSGMVTMVPITTRDKIVSPSQVKFYNDREVSNVILCENIRTFDYKSGAYIFDFMGNISDEILEKVDVAISIHLGLHYSPITLKSLYDSMEAIIKSVGYMQQKADTPKFTDDDVIQFAEKLQMLASTPASDEVSATRVENNTFPEQETVVVDIPKKPDHINTYISKEDMSKVRASTSTHVPPEPTSPVVTESKPARIKWTREKCEEFISDSNTLPMLEVMEKWHISKKTRFYSMKNYVEGLLEKTT